MPPRPANSLCKKSGKQGKSTAIQTSEAFSLEKMALIEEPQREQDPVNSMIFPSLSSYPQLPLRNQTPV